MRVKQTVMALAGLLALAACSTTLPPAPHPPKRWHNAARLTPPQRSFKLSDGAMLPARIWPAPNTPHAIMLALHGFNDSRDAWEVSAPFFAEHGMTVVAPDQRGFGQAPDRSDWAGTRRMVADIKELIAQLQHENPDMPLYTVGESMGGTLLMVMMAQPDAPQTAGTILLAPAVWDVGGEASIPLQLMKSLAPYALVPQQSVPVHVVATDNMAALIRLYYDPQTLHATRWKALAGLVELMKEAADSTPSVRGPVLCVYGDKDQLVPASAMAKVWQTMRQMHLTVRQDLITGGHHLLLRDRQGTLVMQDIVSWISAPQTWLPSGGDSAAGVWFSQQQGRLGAGKSGVLPLLPAGLENLVKR
ncbi:MAG: alpha/beta hydrolase [Acetobacter cibinongensis]